MLANKASNSVDSRNFKKWGRSPTTTQNVGEGLKILGDDFMIKFKLIKIRFQFIYTFLTAVDFY